MQTHKTCLQLCGVLYDSRIIRQLFPLMQLTIKTYDRNSGATRYQRNRVGAGAGKRQRHGVFSKSTGMSLRCTVFPSLTAALFSINRIQRIPRFLCPGRRRFCVFSTKYAFGAQIRTRWAVTMKQLLIRTVCADFIHAVFVSYMSVNRLPRRCRYTYTPPGAPFDAPDGCSAHRSLFRRSTTGNSELSYWRCRTECRKQH